MRERRHADAQVGVDHLAVAFGHGCEERLEPAQQHRGVHARFDLVARRDRFGGQRLVIGAAVLGTAGQLAGMRRQL